MEKAQPKISSAKSECIVNGSEFIDLILALQLKLIYLSYDIGQADGMFGANTEKAVRAFQKKHGLDVDGKVGDLTKKAIEEEVKAKREIDEESGSIQSVEDPEFDWFKSNFMNLTPSQNTTENTENTEISVEA